VETLLYDVQSTLAAWSPVLVFIGGLGVGVVLTIASLWDLTSALRRPAPTDDPGEASIASTPEPPGPSTAAVAMVVCVTGIPGSLVVARLFMAQPDLGGLGALALLLMGVAFACGVGMAGASITFYQRVRGLVRWADGSASSVARVRSVRRLTAALAAASCAGVVVAILMVLEGARHVVY
jgi:hypothetical protein